MLSNTTTQFNVYNQLKSVNVYAFQLVLDSQNWTARKGSSFII